MLGRLVDQYLTQSRTAPSFVWGNMLPLLKSTDLNLVNLETALTKSNKKVFKKFNFKATPDKVQALIEASIQIVNIANNHVLDYSKEGLLETLDTLKQFNIQYVGAGRNLSEARSPVIVSLKGIKIGILGCTDNEPTWIATDQHPGVHYIDVEKNLFPIKQDIDQLRPQVDFLILSIHWGPNMREQPSKSFIKAAHQLIDQGVDLIHGHSAHIFQGVEVYKGKLILYDTGDFVDDYYVGPELRNDLAFLFLVEINRQGLRSLRLIPTLISHFQVNQLQSAESKNQS